MASSATTPWQIEGEKFETVIDFLFLSTKITVDGDCSHEIRWLLLGQKTMTNLNGVLKSKEITLPTKVHIIKAMVFPVAMEGCESWTIKKTEWWRIDVFELWCWRRQLRISWTARRSNQSILKEINPEYSLEGLMLKLKLQSFGHLMQNSCLTGKDPDAGKDWRQKKSVREGEMGVGITDSVNKLGQTLGDGERQGSLVCCSPWSCRVGHNWATEQQTLNIVPCVIQ